jgi:hypothetical protein
VISVPLRSRKRRRGLVAQKFQHVIPAFPLLLAGVQTFRHAPHGLPLVLAVFEIATSVLLLGTVVREVRSLRKADAHAGHSSHGVDWFHIFAAGVLLAEAAEHWHEAHHWKRPTLVTAGFTFLLGIFHGRIQAWGEDRRSLKIDEDGISVGRPPFGTFRAAWKDVKEIEVGPRYGTIHLRDGRRRRIDLHDCEQPAPVRDALAEAQARVVPNA